MSKEAEQLPQLAALGRRSAQSITSNVRPAVRAQLLCGRSREVAGADDVRVLYGAAATM
jgi:hypothetical protein